MPKVLVLKAPGRHGCDDFWLFLGQILAEKIKISSRDGCVIFYRMAPWLVPGRGSEEQARSFPMETFASLGIIKELSNA